MFNTRMFALAAAMSVLFATFVFAQAPEENSDVIEAGGKVSAWVEDIVFANGTQDYEFGEHPMMTEQVVEGHTTYVLLERIGQPVNRSAQFNITGFVRCDYVAEGSWDYAFGIVPVPRKVDRAGVECDNGHRVIITPSMLDSASSGPMTTTGRQIPITTPLGETGWLEEYVFTATHEDPWSGTVARDYYAWSAPVFTPWIHDDGRMKNLWLPLPEDRLAEMGLENFDINVAPRL